MQKIILWIFFCGAIRYRATAQLDSSPLKVKSPGAESRFVGGVDQTRVMNYFQEQQFDEALDYLSPVLQADSDNIPVLNDAGYAYFMTDNSHGAYNCYRRILNLDSNHLSALHYLVLLQSNSDPDEALRYATRLLQLQPTRAAWWRTMGELFARKNQPDTALTYFDRAYTLAPGDVKTIAGLADVLINKKNFSRTDSILNIALAKDSLNSTLLRLRVRSAYLNQDYADAITPGEHLLQMADPGAQALEWLALSYYDLRRYPDCVRVCGQMLEMGFALEAVYYYESRALAKLKDYRQSDSLLRICLSISIAKTTEWYYDDLADNHESLKEYRAALAHYDTAFYLFREPLALYACGRICEVELHNTVLARQYYRRYLALAKPATAEEKKAYGYVKKRWGRGELKRNTRPY